MLVWGKLFTLVLSLALMILKVIERWRIESEVKTKIAKELIEAADAQVRDAIAARNSISRNAGDILGDPDNRDNSANPPGSV